MKSILFSLLSLIAINALASTSNTKVLPTHSGLHGAASINSISFESAKKGSKRTGGTNSQVIPMQQLTNHKILITGAARGLGEAFARAALLAGARVVLTDVLDERGAALALELNAAFEGSAKYLRMDVSDSASVTSAMAGAVTWLGGLDGLVNNAAITNSGGKPMEAIAEDVWDKVMAVNVKGTWLTTVAAKPHLIRASKESGCGRVVNVASDTAIWGAPNLMAYVASKGAVMALTHSMARELGEFGVTVNAIAPGLTLGESTEYVPKARYDHYQNGRAIKREQTANDITASMMFLLSKESGYITGQVLPVNGGFVMN
jgi:NAD(P)-dependent dehydrogenase (short-subunit alcohol dehydrogenase family)